MIPGDIDLPDLRSQTNDGRCFATYLNFLMSGADPAHSFVLDQHWSWNCSLRRCMPLETLLIGGCSTIRCTSPKTSTGKCMECESHRYMRRDLGHAHADKPIELAQNRERRGLVSANNVVCILKHHYTNSMTHILTPIIRPAQTQLDVDCTIVLCQPGRVRINSNMGF